MSSTRRYFYTAPNLADIALIESDALEGTTERHKVSLAIGSLAPLMDPRKEIGRFGPVDGVVVGMDRGWPGISHLRFARWALSRQLRVWFHWPEEDAVECVDAEQLRTYWRLRTLVGVYDGIGKIRRLMGQPEDVLPELVRQNKLVLKTLIERARPVALSLAAGVPTAERPMGGTGAYLRLDFWTDNSGVIVPVGSDGYPCYVARALKDLTGDLVCFTPSRSALLDELGVHQVVLDTPYREFTEESAVRASGHYLEVLRPVMQAMRPKYLYERYCLGSVAGTVLSQELGVPYVLEYRRPELMMNRQRFDDAYAMAEEAAFKQATFIIVASQSLKDALVRRQVDPARILVNPDGADPDHYQVPSAETRREARRELGFGDDARVIGFSETLDGWIGADAMAEAIPAICAQSPQSRFLLIGDAISKAPIDKAIAVAGLQGRVVSKPRWTREDGVRWLSACDVVVLPHNSDVVNTRFSDVPTKLFEYMSMGLGIVASASEQVAAVLSPGLRVDELAGHAIVTDQRAVLSDPGDTASLVSAVVALVDQPAVRDALGRNARQAVIDHYTWRRHVERDCRFFAGEVAQAEPPPAAAKPRIETGDEYKNQVQNQWDNNPVGSQYAKSTRVRSLEWFKEIEAHRYGDYAPWMPEVMEFREHAGHDVLEIGAGVGTDLSQFATNGARVTDIDLSAGHLRHAKENFAARGLTGTFIHHDAESLPFDDNSFDIVYSNGVIHHTPNTVNVVREIRRVLRPGGRAIVMMYAENSIHYFYWLAWRLGLEQDRLHTISMGEIMSRYVEITQNEARPLVKVYSARRLRALFDGFDQKKIYKRQLTPADMPPSIQWFPLKLAELLGGWNLIIKARKPR